MSNYKKPEWELDENYFQSFKHIGFVSSRSGEGHVFAKSLLNQICQDAVVEYIVKETQQREDSYQLGLREGTLKARKEFSDEIIFVQGVINTIIEYVTDNETNAALSYLDLLQLKLKSILKSKAETSVK